MGMGYLTMVIFFATLTEEYAFFVGMFLILAVCFAVTAAVKLKKKRRSGRIFAVSAVVCLMFMGMNCYNLFELIETLNDDEYLQNGSAECPEYMADLKGLDYNECKSEYAACFDMHVIRELYSSEYPAGTIISHTPEEGVYLWTKGSCQGYTGPFLVECTVSKGPQMIMVPNTYTLDIDTSCQMIESVGLTYSFTNEYSETVPEGCVISTTPERNEMIEKGSTVNIVVSKGSEETFAEPEESELLINKKE